MKKWMVIMLAMGLFGFALQVSAKTLKKYKLRADQIKRLAPNHGRCAATVMITVQGHKVGYMCRYKPKAKDDSGWAFFDGFEPPSYLDNPKNIEIYDVNTIANYDPEIIPFLDMPVGSAFERDSKSGKFIKADPLAPEDQ